MENKQASCTNSVDESSDKSSWFARWFSRILIDNKSGRAWLYIVKELQSFLQYIDSFIQQSKTSQASNSSTDHNQSFTNNANAGDDPLVSVVHFVILSALGLIFYLCKLLMRPRTEKEQKIWADRWFACIEGLVFGTTLGNMGSKSLPPIISSVFGAVVGGFAGMFFMCFFGIFRKRLYDVKDFSGVRIGMQLGSILFATIATVIAISLGVACVGTGIGISLITASAFVGIFLCGSVIGGWTFRKLVQHFNAKEKDQKYGPDFVSRVDRGAELRTFGALLGAAIGTLFAPGPGTVIGALCGSVIMNIVGMVIATYSLTHYYWFLENRSVHFSAKVVSTIGMACGATIGTFLCPVIGTFVGATIGGLLGLLPYAVTLLLGKPQKKAYEGMCKEYAEQYLLKKEKEDKEEALKKEYEFKSCEEIEALEEAEANKIQDKPAPDFYNRTLFNQYRLATYFGMFLGIVVATAVMTTFTLASLFIAPAIGAISGVLLVSFLCLVRYYKLGKGKQNVDQNNNFVHEEKDVYDHKKRSQPIPIYKHDESGPPAYHKVINEELPPSYHYATVMPFQTAVVEKREKRKVSVFMKNRKVPTILVSCASPESERDSEGYHSMSSGQMLFASQGLELPDDRRKGTANHCKVPPPSRGRGLDDEKVGFSKYLEENISKNPNKVTKGQSIKSTVAPTLFAHHSSLRLGVGSIHRTSSVESLLQFDLETSTSMKVEAANHFYEKNRCCYFPQADVKKQPSTEVKLRRFPG